VIRRRHLITGALCLALAASCSGVGGDNQGGDSGAGGGSSSGGGSSGSGGSGSGSGSGSSSGSSSGRRDGGAGSSSGSGGSSSGSGSGSSSGSSSGVGDAGRDSGSGSSSGSSSSGSVTGPSPCTWGSTNGATFTEYYFGQTSPPTTKVACGYTGMETTSAGFSSVDQVNNIANKAPANNTYFAAIPGASNMSWPVTDCGACVKIGSIIATIVDLCPTGSNQNPRCTESNHLDLSTAAFSAAGFGNNGGDPSGSWQFIACPVTGNIQAVPNSVAGNQYYFENAVYPISTVNGQAPSTFGYFTVAPGPLTIVSSAVGQTITGGALPSGGGDTGMQFKPPATCP